MAHSSPALQALRPNWARPRLRLVNNAMGVQMTLLDRINLADAIDTAIARVQREMTRAADSNDWRALRVQYDALVAEKRRIGQGG